MRTRSWKGLAAAGLLAAAIPAAMVWVTVRACGPDFEPEVFVPQHQPAQPRHYADGHLGIVQRGYFHTELVVAYRYLSGGKLSEAEKAVYAPPPQPRYDTQYWQALEAAKPVNRWMVARAGAAATAAQTGIGNISQDRVVETPRPGYVERDDQLNCTDSAFETAIATLASRTNTWGAQSPDLAEWLRGQDAVFSNCSKTGSTPDPAKSQWSALLRQDRAYQIAAAKLYRADYDGAVADFVAIGKDGASPWSRWGEYLAARTEVRKASSTTRPAGWQERANFENDEMAAAQTRLLKLEEGTHDPEIQHAAVAERHFIEARLQPGKRLDEVSAALAGPRPDPEFAQDLIDFDVLMGWNAPGQADMVKWVQRMQGGPPIAAGPGMASAGETRDSLTMWLQQRNTPWLVAAMTESRVAQPANADLMAAASTIQPDSPAYATVSFHRARLLLMEQKLPEARELLTAVLTNTAKNDSATRNALLGQRMPTARTLAEFLTDAPRTMIQSGSEAASIAECGSWGSAKEGCVQKIPEAQFDTDAADAFNQQLPLALWAQAAESSVLPQNLREAVAWAGWLRALGLSDSAMVRRLAPKLPQPVFRATGESDGFPATLALLRNPGFRPYLQQGVQRSVTFGASEEFRDNWWCSKWGDEQQLDQGNKSGVTTAPAPTPLSFLTSGQRKSGADELVRLNQLPLGVTWLGRRAIAYVKTHPNDKDAPEALALTVHATHYGCGTWQPDPAEKAVSKEAFEMLHSKYPRSEWALKTKYYY